MHFTKKRSAYLFAIAPLCVSLLFLTCDTRSGGTGGGGGNYYTMDFFPDDSVTVPDEIVYMNCIVRDAMGEQVGGVTINFVNLDSGFIVSSATSNSLSPDGVSGDLIYDPNGNYGLIHIVAKIFNSNDFLICSDTAVINVLPYILEELAVHDTLVATQSTEIYCRILDPRDNAQLEDKHIQFLALDFGNVPSNWIYSSATSFSGLKSLVLFSTLSNYYGEARIVANAIWGSQQKVMGSDTITVNVLRNPYVLNLSAVDWQVVPDDSSEIICILEDTLGNRLGGTVINFNVLDFGWIPPSAYSSYYEPNGIEGQLFFNPLGYSGINRITAHILDNIGSGAIVNIDTIEIESVSYELNLSSASDTISVNDNVELSCLLINPLTQAQTGNRSVRFYPLDFGVIIPDEVLSDETNSNGLAQIVYYLPNAVSGIARIQAQALSIYDERVMGESEIITIYVTP